MREIKSAYRKKALKLHPDVNKAPDAQARFMEAKMAFQTLSDDRARADYDRKLRMGFGSSKDWNSFGSAAGRAGAGGGFQSTRPRQAQPQDDYNFEDFMRDLDKEVASWAKERSKAASPQDRPGSLFEELAMVGEEFVEFLEESLGLKEDGKKASTPGGAGSSSSSSSSSSSRQGLGLDGSAVDAFDKLMEALGLDKDDGPKKSSSRTGSSSTAREYTSRQSASTADWKGGAQRNQTPPKSTDEDLDAMLAELKRKLGRDR